MTKTIILNADLTPLGESTCLVIIEEGRFSGVLDMQDRHQVSTLGARVVDAGGRSVLPGIDDSHLHAYSYGRSLTAHDFRGTTGLVEFQNRLRLARPEDEPFASVDAQTRFDLEDLVLKVRDDFGITTLMVTHDIDEAVYLSDEIVVLHGKPASVRDVVKVEIPFPRSQMATRNDPRFADLRTRVYGMVRGLD